MEHSGIGGEIGNVHEGGLRQANKKGFQPPFGDLHVRILGHTALMTGRQLLEVVRKRTGERVRIDSQVIQVWVLEGDRWQQIAFQTTPTDMSVETNA